MLADKNGRPLRSKQKTLYLCNVTVLGRTPLRILSPLTLIVTFAFITVLRKNTSCIRSVEVVGITLLLPCSPGWQNSDNRQMDTHTQTKHRNPRCACAPRVNWPTFCCTPKGVIPTLTLTLEATRHVHVYTHYNRAVLHHSVV